MALTDKKYEKFYKTTGGGSDEIPTSKLTKAESDWDLERAKGMDYHMGLPEFAPLIFQIQQMQDELDYLRTEISANKDKTTFPGFGTSSSTALAGDTTTISTAQANAITANTAKTSMVIGSRSTEAMAGNTTIPPISVTGLPANHTFDVQVRVMPPPKGAKKGTIVLTWTITDVPNRVMYSGNQTLI